MIFEVIAHPADQIFVRGGLHAAQPGKFALLFDQADASLACLGIEQQDSDVEPLVTHQVRRVAKDVGDKRFVVLFRHFLPALLKSSSETAAGWCSWRRKSGPERVCAGAIIARRGASPNPNRPHTIPAELRENTRPAHRRSSVLRCAPATDHTTRARSR